VKGFEMNVLITGGTGFFGHWLKQTQPEDVTAQYLSKDAYENGHWEWYDWDAIIHCANISPLHVIQAHKGKLMYVSSGAVYEGTNEYAENKRKWEAQCPEGTIIVRPFTFIGEKLKLGYAITNFIDAAKNGRTMHVNWGSSNVVRTYLHGFDLGNWLWKILLEGEGIYDVGSEIKYTILQVAELVCQVYKGARYSRAADMFSHILYDNYVPDITRAKALGCVETIGLREAIERTKDAKKNV
jgi:nucleoside-diphosphate-sugar epimerase